MNTLEGTGEKDRVKGSGSAAELTIRDMAGAEDAAAFCALNEEWISRYFVLEERDREQLRSPETIVSRGGRVFLAWRGGVAVGCCALVPMGESLLELAKMAVAPEMRGLGMGRAIILHVIAAARAMGVATVFLDSNSKLVSAVALYESVGFRHVDPETLPKLAYSRANVFMRMEL